MNDREPRAYRLDLPAAERPDLVVSLPELDPYDAEARALVALPAGTGRRRRGFSWGGLFAGAFGSLVSLGIGLWGWRLVEDLLAANPVLGMVAGALAGISLLALLVIGFRELWSLRQLDRVESLREDAAKAFAADDLSAARRVVQRLRAMSRAPEAASALAELDDLKGEIIDGADLLTVAERLLLAPRDARAKEAIAAAARRVSVVTAISPRALVDLLFVLAQSVRLVRRIAEAYGARPSHLGALKLAGAVVTHLTVTGGMAVGDGLVSQVLGAGLAARLSAKLGEGVLNGVLTARIGLAAIAVCRPMPFLGEKPPLLTDVAGSLFSGGKAEEKTAG